MSTDATPTTAGEKESNLLWQTIVEFMSDGCSRMAAALSYYTLFSLPPLLVLLMMLASALIEAETVESLLESQIGGLLGPEGAAQVRTMLRNVRPPGVSASLATLLSVGALLFGATAAFAQLQDALNTAWEVGPDPTRGDIKNYLLKRVLSFAMILAIGFLLLVSLVVSAILTALTDAVSRLTPAGLSAPALFAINNGASFAIIALLFAAMFTFLPDAIVRWRDALLGGAVTALLFTIGKFLISYYLGSSDPGSAYGAAGSLALVLVWIYYTSMILLFGAEFTQVWAERRGVPIQPEPGAVRLVRTQQRVEREKGTHGTSRRWRRFGGTRT